MVHFTNIGSVTLATQLQKVTVKVPLTVTIPTILTKIQKQNVKYFVQNVLLNAENEMSEQINNVITKTN